MSMKLIRGLLASSMVCVFATPAMAASGTIHFTGAITAASCTISSGAGTQVSGAPGKQVINVELGTISMDSIGDGSANTGIAGGTAINLNLDCGNTAGGLTNINVTFDPMSGSGIDASNNKLLKIDGSAKGVGIGIYKADAANTLLNLSGNDTFDGAMVETGVGQDAKYTAQLNLRAGYVKNGEALVAGSANGTLPFTLSYK